MSSLHKTKHMILKFKIKKTKNGVEDYIQMIAPLRIWWNKKLSFRGQTVDDL